MDNKTKLIKEQEELEKKLDSLNAYNQSDIHRDPAQEKLLFIMAGAMYTYNECLKAVISTL